MLSVKEILEDGSAVVCTDGLYRILIQPAGTIAEELLDEGEAHAFVEAYNGCEGRFWAEAVSYSHILSS